MKTKPRMTRIISLISTLLLSSALALQANPVHIFKIHQSTTIGVEACADGIYRVRIAPDGAFPESLMERYGLLNTDWAPAGEKVSDKGGVWTLSTATHKLTINKKSGLIVLYGPDGKPRMEGLEYLRGSNRTSVALAKVINEKYAGMHVAKNDGIIGDDKNEKKAKDNAESGEPSDAGILRFTLGADERFYGGGSTSREHIQHRGEILRMWTTYQHTEIPMPFVMSSRGWGVFNNTTRKNFFDIGCTEKDKFNIFNTFDTADFYLFAASSMPGVLDLYTQVTGRNHVMPKWAYGICFGPNMREDQWDILQDAVHFRSMGAPCDVFWLEPQWMEKRYDFSTQKKWNFDKFSPEPYWVQDKYPKKLYNRLFIGKLRHMGFHLGLWLCEEYDLSITEEDEIAAREGRPQSGQEHWMDHLKTFIDYGAEGFKLDPARTIDEHAGKVYYNGHEDKEMHNLNQVLLQKQMKQMSRNHTGKRLWWHYTAGWAGTQRWGASTSGDNGGGKTALFDQLNLGNSSYFNLSCDVMSVPAELEMQGLHFGMFLPWIQINSWFSMMQPFYYGEPEQSIYRDYLKLRYTLAPYVYTGALEAHICGMPIVRSMPLAFPDDRNVDDMCYQYMFGPSLCVGIFSNEIYLPEGEWIDAWTGERIVSRGETMTRSFPAHRAGLLLVKDGAIIPTQPDVQYLGAKPFDKLIIKVFPKGESSFVLREDDGDTYAYETGAIASTLLQCSEGSGKVSFTINPAEGAYEGMPEERCYSFEFALKNVPATVSVGGKKLEGWQFADGVLTFTLPSVAAAAKTEIEIALSGEAAVLSGDRFLPTGAAPVFSSPARPVPALSSEEVLY